MDLIQIGSEMEVNINGESRRLLEAARADRVLDEEEKVLRQNISKQLFTNLEMDAYPRFLQSTQAKQLKALIDEKKKGGTEYKKVAQQYLNSNSSTGVLNAVIEWSQPTRRATIVAEELLESVLGLYRDRIAAQRESVVDDEGVGGIDFDEFFKSKAYCMFHQKTAELQKVCVCGDDCWGADLDGMSRACR